MSSRVQDQGGVLTRREVLGGLGCTLAATAVGCSGDPAEGLLGGTEPEVDPRSTLPEPERAACQDADRETADALWAGIDTFVVLCLENRSFDHLLGSLSLLEGRQIDGLRGNEWNPAPDGSRVPVWPMADTTVDDPPHGWDDGRTQWNGGRNDGFVRAHAGVNQTQVMGFHTRAEVPIHYWLADEFAVCDRWFCSVMGPTWPNRMYLHGADSQGRTNNTPVFGFESIFGRLEQKGLSATNYFHDVCWASAATLKFRGNEGIERFFEQAAAGTLPNYSLIDPQFFGAMANDDHPDHDVRLGQALVASVMAALARSPQWSRCLFVVTYDEHGGFFDHVPPPTTVDSRSDFRQLGFRVPGLVAGPYVKRGCTVSTTFDHVSILSTLTRRFGLNPLNDRLRAAPDLTSCLDPATLGRPRPAPVVPAVPVSLSRLRARRVVDDHPELADMVTRANLPPELDRRREGAAIAGRVLDWGERLGAVEILP